MPSCSAEAECPLGLTDAPEPRHEQLLLPIVPLPLEPPQEQEQPSRRPTLLAALAPQLRLADLEEECFLRHVAEEAGLPAAVELACRWGGQKRRIGLGGGVLRGVLPQAALESLAWLYQGERVFISHLRSVLRPARNRNLAAEFRGGSSCARLAQRWQLSPPLVKRVLSAAGVLPQRRTNPRHPAGVRASGLRGARTPGAGAAEARVRPGGALPGLRAALHSS